MCKPWVKLHSDIIHDRKMWKLSEREQLVFFKLIALAGFEDKNGELPALEDIALELRISEKKLKPALKKLIEFEMLEEIDGGFFLSNFEKRQQKNWYGEETTSVPMTNAERVRKYRAKKTTETAMECNDSETQCNENKPLNHRYICNADVTPCNVLKEKEKDIDTEIEKEKELKPLFCETQNVEIEKKTVSKTSEKSGKSKTEKTKLTPENDGWWDCFKDAKEMAKTFSETSGIIPTNSEIGRWRKDLKQFAEAKLSVEDMVCAIADMRNKGLTISAPSSVFKIARDLKYRPQTATTVKKSESVDLNDDLMREILTEMFKRGEFTQEEYEREIQRLEDGRQKMSIEAKNEY